MTDIEKLAAALEKQSLKLGPFAHEIRAGTINRAMRDLGITIKDAVGLIEGTHVVVPVEPTEAMTRAGGDQIGDTFGERPLRIPRNMDSAGNSYKAMLKAAQGDL